VKENFRWSKILFAISVLTLFILLTPRQSAYAATQLQVASIEYYDENIVVFNNSNTKIFFATENDAAKDSWDVMPVDEDSDFTTIDISWLSPSAENTIMIKGDADQTPARIHLDKRPSKLDISISYSLIDKLPDDSSIGPLINIMASAGDGINPITITDLEWRKSDAGQWKSTKELTVGMLEKFLIKGADLYFRIRAIDDNVSINKNGVPFNINDDRYENGYSGGIVEYQERYKTDLTYGNNYPDGTDGRRSSSETKVKISKQMPTMVYGIDGEEFTADIKYGKEYKVTITYPDDSDPATPEEVTTNYWTQVIDKSVRTIPLATIANSFPPRKDADGKPIVYDGVTVAFPKMLIEVRDYATSKNASSKISEISLDPQETITKTILVKDVPADAVAKGDSNIYVSYNGDKNIVLTVPLASTQNPYEYTVVKKGAVLDLDHAVWSSITKNIGIKVLASKALDDGTLYVRRKEIESKEATKFSPAIAYKLASTSATLVLDYPSVPVAAKESFTYVKGYPKPIVITIQLNQSGKVPFETEIESIKLGTRVIGFDPKTSVSVDDPTVKIMKVTLNEDDIKLLPNCSAKALTITYKNGTIDKSTVKLTIKNPTKAEQLNATAQKGTVAGTTSVKMYSTLGKDNTFVYIIGDKDILNVNKEDVLVDDATVKPFSSEVNIPIPTEGQYLTIYEINKDRNIIKFKCIQITSAYRL
jgi:hypothetical protein